MTEQQQQQQQQQQPQQPPSLIGACIACICLLICTPLMVCCCCVAGANTVAHKAQGQRWDEKQKKWVVDNLEEEEQTLKNVPADDDDILQLAKEAEEKQDAKKSGSTKTVKETAYYDVLGVSPDADEKKIKRAYYVEARKWHPDKNDSDEAKVKFQKIGEAYQVLGDEKLRKVYDKQGEEGLSGDRTEAAMEKVDPSLIFTFLFGSDSFDGIVGRLSVVTETMVGDSKETKIGREHIFELERRRVLRLALKLRERIQKHVDGDANAADAWKAEAAKLVEVRYGEELLNTVGRSYRLVATQCIGNWGDGMEAKIKEREATLGAATAAAAGMQAMQKQGEVGDQLPEYIEFMWNVTVIDITTTVREVVMKVVCDKSVDDTVQKKRANAIIELGKIWEEKKSKKAKTDRRSARGLYQSAAAAAMEKTLNEMQEREGKE